MYKYSNDEVYQKYFLENFVLCSIKIFVRNVKVTNTNKWFNESYWSRKRKKICELNCTNEPFFSIYRYI